MNKEIHNLLKIENDKTTIFTNQELKMIDDYINELEAYKYNMDSDYLRLEKENKELKEKNETIQEKFKEWKKDIEKERKFYLCERDCAFRLKESKKYLSYTRQIEQLEKENKKLKEVIDKLSSQIKLYGKYNGEKCTRGFSMMTADFNKLLDILKEVNK